MLRQDPQEEPTTKEEIKFLFPDTDESDLSYLNVNLLFLRIFKSIKRI